MVLSELLFVTKKPSGWSRSAYYRLKCVCKKAILSNIDSDIDVNPSNIDNIVRNINVNINYVDDRKYNRTLKTYLGELRRYLKYRLDQNITI